MKKENAIEAWNTRKPMEAVVADIVRIGKTLCDNVECNEKCGDCDHGCLMQSIVESIRSSGKE